VTPPSAAPQDEGAGFILRSPAQQGVTKDAAQLEEGDADERAMLQSFPPLADDADFFFHLLKTWDRRFVWRTISANNDADMVSRLTMSDLFLPGFADSGAHLTNLAFYDVNLRALKIALETQGDAGAAYMVKRLTRDAAEVFGLDAGTIDVGAQGDLVLIDPEALKRHDGEKNTVRLWREVLKNDQLVCRSDGVVRAVFIRGEEAWDGAAFTPAFERKKMGRVLKAKDAELAAPMAMAAE
jgi:N-acyl-D-aspartate/D-glutamate deacylase